MGFASGVTPPTQPSPSSGLIPDALTAVTAGADYWILVYDNDPNTPPPPPAYNDFAGDMNMTVTIASGATPTNDAFANAIAILDPSAPSTDPTLDINGPARSVDGTTTGATIEAGEPVHGAGPRSVWYSFTPQRTGTLKFAVTDPTGALIPSTNVELYTGSAVGGLTTWSYGPTASLRQQLILSGGVGYIGVARGVPYSIAVSAGSTTGSGFTLKLNYLRGFATTSRPPFLSRTVTSTEIPRRRSAWRRTI